MLLHFFLLNRYKKALSQPAPGLSYREKLLWLQKRRTEGLWVQCDDCDRWRYLPDILERHQLPIKWYCRMNPGMLFVVTSNPVITITIFNILYYWFFPDTSAADCSVPETLVPLHDEEDLIHNEYSAGSVVWARLDGWPWWPAMVDDCPDTEQFYWLDGFSDIPVTITFYFLCICILVM